MASTGLVLFAHGARDVRWVEPFERIKAKVQAQAPGVPVELAYLELMAPDLAAAAAALVAAGCSEVRVVPVFLAQGGHMRNDLPRLVEAIAAHHPGVSIRVAAPVGEDDAVLDCIAERCLAEITAGFAHQAL